MTRPRQLAAFTLIALIWGSEWIARQAIDAPPLQALAIRYAIAAAILALVIAARRIRLPQRPGLLGGAIAGVLLLAAPPALTFYAADRISPGLLIAILSMTPLWAALLERNGTGVPLQLIAGIGGIALIMTPALSFDGTQWAGAAATLAAAISVAASIVYAKRELLEIHPIALAAIQLAAGCIVVGLASLALEGRSEWLLSGQSLTWEILLASSANALAFPLYYYLLRQLESFQLTSMQWVVTLVSVAEGLILLRQPPSWQQLAGASVLVAGLWSLATRRSNDEKPLTIQITQPPL